VVSQQSWPQPGICTSVCTAAADRDVDPLKSHLIEEWKHFHQAPGVHQQSGQAQAVASTSSSLHSSTRRTFWTQTLSMFDICTNAYTLTVTCLSGYLSWTLNVLSDLTKPAIAIADINRFYWNLAFCLQLNVALLIQKFAKIWHCLPELWKYIPWFTFFPDTV